MRIILLILGSLGIADTIFASNLSNHNIGVWLPSIIGLPLLLLGIFYKPVGAFFHASGFGTCVKWVLIAGYGVFFALFFVCSVLIYREGHAKPPAGADAVIVLGCAVRGENPSLTLTNRLDAACEYLAQNPNTRVVVSGGQGPGEDITEAEAMRRYLSARGVDASRIFMEDKSLSTYENFRNSKAIIDEQIGEEASIVFITTRFHVFRSERIAAALGVRAAGFGADGILWLEPNNYLRETCAILIYWLVGRI